MIIEMKYEKSSDCGQPRCPECSGVLSLTSDGHPTLSSASCLSCKYTGSHNQILTPEVFHKHTVNELNLQWARESPQFIEAIFNNAISLLLSNILNDRCSDADAIACAKILRELRSKLLNIMKEQYPKMLLNSNLISLEH